MTEASASGRHLERLKGQVHHDPHSFLGIHRTRDRFILRVFHPVAEEVEVRAATSTTLLEKTHEDGLFTTLLDTQPASYQLLFRGAGHSWTARDPYCFTPTLGSFDLHLIQEGTHLELWKKLGARETVHQGVGGVAFAVWAPNAQGVSLMTDASHWDDRLHPMRSMGGSGIWELFLPDATAGLAYKFAVIGSDGIKRIKADPMSRRCEHPPATASIVDSSNFTWQDGDWLKARQVRPHPGQLPVSVYEVHPGSWRRDAHNRVLSYTEMGEALAEYCTSMGFTHVELMPMAEHPLTESWGYQVTSYFAPTSRYGTPDQFRQMVDHLHRNGIGVFIDWVPAHFPRDEWALANFDGTALYEHPDPRRGEHPDWGTLVFNFGRTEVRNFLIANALFWIEEFHVDGVRVDAVASMLYLDYSRPPGGWEPNIYGGRENLEAVSFLRDLNSIIGEKHPSVVTVAEESTSWPGVSHPVDMGGLGFHFKWNMGWMHDTLDYMEKEPIFRKYHHNEMTFSLWYAWSENFILPISHDENVHGKGSLLGKMPGDEWQRFANLRVLLGWMWSHPGKKLLFMGSEFGQYAEWNCNRSLDWHLLEFPAHMGVQKLVAALNRVYRETPELWEADTDPQGFVWLDAGNADQNLLSFLRCSRSAGPQLACIANFSPNTLSGYRVGLPLAGIWKEVLNTDAAEFGGSGKINPVPISTEQIRWNEQEHSATITVPPLGMTWLLHQG